MVIGSFKKGLELISKPTYNQSINKNKSSLKFLGQEKQKRS
jgi:hypothetical protein